MKSHLIKRSFRLTGHATSVALEAEFWIVLAKVAEEQSKSLAALVAQVDEARAGSDLPLASALRLEALSYARKA